VVSDGKPVTSAFSRQQGTASGFWTDEAVERLLDQQRVGLRLLAMTSGNLRDVANALALYTLVLASFVADMRDFSVTPSLAQNAINRPLGNISAAC
jgi:hypothetical protein